MIRPRFVVVAVVTLALAQLAAREWVGEPYPGVFQPSFAISPTSAEIATDRYREMRVIFADGSEEQLDPRRLLSSSGGTPSSGSISSPMIAVLSRSLESEDQAASSTRSWLRSAIESEFPGRVPEVLVIRDVETQRRVPSGELVTRRSLRVRELPL